jgi:hypothetical protein
MSEYQYYEFHAIDRPLTKAEMAELRAISTRATITPTRFMNVYNYGDFKGDPQKLMEKYFDAFVYVANWGTRELMLRLPRSRFDPAQTRPYFVDETLDIHLSGDQVILTFRSEDEEAGDWEEGEGWIGQLAPIRAEIAAGDWRALYLGWLQAIQRGYFEDEEAYEDEYERADEEEAEDEAEGDGDSAIEPPVPAGLGSLSASLQALVAFLRVDPDLVAAAAEKSPARAPARPSTADLARWIRDLPVAEKDDLLVRLAAGEASHLSAELQRRFLEATAPARSPQAGAPEGRRSVRELLGAAEERAQARRRAEAERAAREQARREKEAAVARAAYLDGLGGREEDLWRQVEALIDTKRPQDYDRAVQLLLDLRDLDRRAPGAAGFETRLAALGERHARKPTLIERLERAGLL